MTDPITLPYSAKDLRHCEWESNGGRIAVELYIAGRNTDRLCGVAGGRGGGG